MFRPKLRLSMSAGEKLPARRLRYVPVLGFAGLLMLLSGCAATNTRTVDGRVSIIAFGDSASGGAATGYPALLTRMGAYPEGAIAGEGRSGERAEAAPARLSAMLKARQYPNARTLLLWEGGNDLTRFLRRHAAHMRHGPGDLSPDQHRAFEGMLAEVSANLSECMRLARDAGMRVYLATYYPLCPRNQYCSAVPWRFLLAGQARRINEYIAALNDRIRSTAAREGAVLVDIAALEAFGTCDPAHYANCNHLSEAGNRVVAQAFLDALN